MSTVATTAGWVGSVTSSTCSSAESASSTVHSSSARMAWAYTPGQKPTSWTSLGLETSSTAMPSDWPTNAYAPTTSSSRVEWSES